jgi:hypothetical protein
MVIIEIENTFSMIEPEWGSGGITLPPCYRRNPDRKPYTPSILICPDICESAMEADPGAVFLERMV